MSKTLALLLLSYWLKMKFKRYIPLFFVNFCFFLALSSACAEEINVVTEYLEPYQIKNHDGSLGGFSTEVVQALFAITGDTANIKVMPWARAYEIATHQKNTLIFSIARTKKREKLFRWVGGITRERLYFWGLKSKFLQPVTAIEQLKSKRIAASRKSNAEQYLIANNFKHIYPLVAEDQTMKMLYRDRVDLIVGTDKTFQARAEKLSFEFDKIVKIIEIKDLNADLSLAFNLHTDDKIMTRYQAAFKQLEASGRLEKIQKKWLIH